MSHSNPYYGTALVRSSAALKLVRAITLAADLRTDLVTDGSRTKPRINDPEVPRFGVLQLTKLL
jgi:hypothetical protein